MSRRLVLIGAAAIGVALPLLAAPAAVADDHTGAALVSLDGTSFSRSLQGSIFSNGVVLVPGGATTGTLHVKNDSERAGDLRIWVAGASSASATLLDALTLQAVTQATPESTPVPLSTDGACVPLLSGELLPSQDITVVEITLGMDAEAGNATQSSEAEAELVVSLTDPASPDAAESNCTDGGGIPLIPAPAPEPDQPVSTTAEPAAATGEDQPVPAPRPDDETTTTGGAAPAAETPPTAGALPQSDWAIPLGWLGAGGLAAGAFTFVLSRVLSTPGRLK